MIFDFILEIATKQDLRARPSKIVAGLEAEKTNEFLIAIARAIDRKIDTTDAVALVKSGNVAGTQKKEPKATAAGGGGAKTTTKTESRTKGGKDANELKKVKSSDAKPSKKADGSKKGAATKQSSKDSIDAKKSKSKTQSREQKDSDKKLSPKNVEPETKVKPIEPQPNVAIVIENTNGNATVSMNL